MSALETKWWHSATGYQIYPRSFADSDGDGVGDIRGIISRLDHLSDLGIGFIWLSPVYRSPMVDNGYDISDYRDIAPEFGTLDDMDALIAEAGRRGIGIVMDLVVNHSSSEHAWFRAARESRQSDTHDYYIWRDAGPDGGPPDARRSYFGGPAWTFVPEVGLHYLHLFTPEQPDLNWRNPALRAEIYDMMRWWLDRGIRGFRMDVIDLIGKDVDAGIDAQGPYLHEYLREMHREVLAGRDALTVGEAWSADLETALDFCGDGRDELDMVFQFAHVTAGWHPEKGKFHPLPFDLPKLKRVFADWQALMESDGWNALFLSNHDLPRQVSRYGDDGAHRVASAKAMATVLHLMKGTPFVYQGEEIGMTNRTDWSLGEARDVETINLYREHVEAGGAPGAFWQGVAANGRDNARTPMQWRAGEGVGFTDGEPWIGVNANASEVNVKADRADPDGVFAHYQRLIGLRRDWPLVVYGRYTPYHPDHFQLVAYMREHEGERLLVVANWSGEAIAVETELEISGRPVIWTHTARAHVGGVLRLAPWEAFAVASI